MVSEAFRCAGCGAALVLRAEGATQAIACEYCGAVLDAQDPRHQLLSKYDAKVRLKPIIPLGTRARLRGEDFEAIGFMRRRVRYYGVDYDWSEYLLYNPFKGFKWLLEYNGHWTLLNVLPQPPAESKKNRPL